MSQRFYTLLFFILLVSLLSVFFWGPGNPPITDDGTPHKQGKLWQQNWEVIEYYPTNTEKANTDKNMATPLMRFIRKPGLIRDSYFVEIPNNKKTIKTYKGNYLAKNIFSDWYQPRIWSYYQRPIKNEEKEKEKPSKKEPSKDKFDTGLENSQIARIMFYSKANSTPVEMSIGNTTKQKRTFIKHTQKPDIFFLLSSYLFNSLNKKNKTDFLERNIFSILDFSESNAIERIELDLHNEKQSYAYTQVMNEKGTSPKSHWFRQAFQEISQKASESKGSPYNKNKKEKSKELPEHLATSLTNTIKSLRIAYFQESVELQEKPELSHLWKNSSDNFLTLKISLKKGTHYTFLFRKNKSLKIKKNLHVLSQIEVKNSQAPNINLKKTHLIQLTQIDAIVQRNRKITEYITQQKEAKKVKGEKQKQP